MKLVKLWVILLGVGAVLWGVGCATHPKATTPKFEKEVGNPYFDSYYLFLTDTTEALLPRLRAKFAQSQSPEISDLIAQVFYRNGRLDSAQAYIERSYRLDSNNVDYAKRYYAILEEQQKDPARLVYLADRLISLDSGDAKNQYSLLMAYIRDNRIGEAIRYGRSRQEFFRRYFEIDQMLINLYLQSQMPDSAMRVAEELIAQDPSESNSYFVASTVAARSNDTLNYKRYFKQGVKYGCPNELLVEAYAQYLLIEQRNPRELLGTLDTIFERCHYPESWLVEMLSNLRFVFTSPRMSDPTERHLLSSFERQLAHSSEGQFVLLQYYRRNFDTAAALALIARNQKTFAPSYIWDMIYVSESLKFRPRPRVSHWGEETRVARENITKYPFDLFSAYVYFEWVGEATDSVRRIDTVDHYIGYYKELLRQAKKDEVYRFELTFGKDTTVQRIPILLANLSRLYGYKGDVSRKDQKAFEAYKEALKYNPSNEVALNNYAYNLALVDAKQLKRALKMSEKSLTIDPNNENYLDTYGYILYRLGRYKEAKAVFTKLLSINPRPGATSLLHYSALLEALGNKDAAEVYRMKATQAESE